MMKDNTYIYDNANECDLLIEFDEARSEYLQQLAMLRNAYYDKLTQLITQIEKVRSSN